jgi:hypothetical protein
MPGPDRCVANGPAVQDVILAPRVPNSWNEHYDRDAAQPFERAPSQPAPALRVPPSPELVRSDDEIPLGQGTPLPRAPCEAPQTPELSELKFIMNDLAKGKGINIEQTEKLSLLLVAHGQAAMLDMERGLGDTVQNENKKTKSLVDASLSAAEQKMRDAASKGTFEVRDAVGQMFTRAPDGAKHTEYKNLKSQIEKKEFREAWLKSSWAKVVTRKQYTKSWSKVDENKGTYMCFEKVMEEEGGNLRAAMMYTQKCIKMHSPWCIWNGMTERVDFLYIRKSSLETFNQCWTFFEDEHPAVEGQSSSSSAASGSVADKPSASSSASGSLAAVGKLAGQPGDKGDDTASSAKRGGEDIEETPKGKKPKGAKTADASGSPPEKSATDNIKSGLQKLMSESTKVKVKYLANMGAATTLLQTISSDPKWKWANNSDMTRDLSEAQARLKGLDDDFSRMFLSEDPKKLRKAYTDEILLVSLDRFKVNFSKAVGDLEFETQQLVRMHSGRAGKK